MAAWRGHNPCFAGLSGFPCFVGLPSGSALQMVLPGLLLWMWVQGLGMLWNKRAVTAWAWS